MMTTPTMPMRTETPSIEIVREGAYMAEVDVTVIETDGGWSPYLSLVDVEKLEAVSHALKQGDIATAQRLGGRVFEVREVAA